MLSSRTTIFKLDRHKQRGAALMVMLIIMVLGSAAFLVSALNSSSVQIERDKKTADALAQAKEALIGFAASVNLGGIKRPGDLPCPDTNNDGVAELSCGSAAGGNQSQRIGLLPYKTLGLPDLRDGSGEKLWYAVSNNFKNNTRTALLNSDTLGTITIRDSAGNIIHNGCSAYGLPNCPNPSATDAGFGTGVVAVIIAPGAVLTRQGSSSPQNRSTTNTASDYLDNVSLTGEDNANFIDGTSTDGFIQGRIKDNSGKIILNDQLLVITQSEIMSTLQKRVASEVSKCLEDYALNNKNSYPWAAPVTDLGPIFSDQQGKFFGRIPDNLNNTSNEINGPTSGHWGTCNTHTNNTPTAWWLNWKELVFYGLAKNFQPNNSVIPASSFPSTCTTVGNCLNINNSSTPAKFIVIVAGKKLTTPDQTLRNSNKSNPFYYLENGNESADQSGGYTFTNIPSVNFNDTVVFH